MKNILIIAFLCLSIGNLKGQIFIQGKGIIPFRSIANTVVLNDANRIHMDLAFEKYKAYELNVSNRTSSKELVGEYYVHNNLLIQLVSRNRNKHVKELSFEELSAMNFEMYTENIYENEAYYFSEIISKNTFKCLVYYDKRDTFINFTIRDNSGKYRIKGLIAFKSGDLTNATSFFDTFINSITFK